MECSAEFQDLLKGSGERCFVGALSIVFCIDYVDGQEVGCCVIRTTWRQAASLMSGFLCLIEWNKAKFAF